MTTYHKLLLVITTFLLRINGYKQFYKNQTSPCLHMPQTHFLTSKSQGRSVLMIYFCDSLVVVRLEGSEVKVKCLNAVCTEHYLAFFVPQISQGVWDLVLSSAQGRIKIRRVVYVFGDCGHDFGRILRGFFPPSAFRT